MFTFVTVCVCFEWKRICGSLLSFVYIWIAVADLVIKSRTSQHGTKNVKTSNLTT